MAPYRAILKKVRQTYGQIYAPSPLDPQRRHFTLHALPNGFNTGETMSLDESVSWLYESLLPSCHETMTPFESLAHFSTKRHQMKRAITTRNNWRTLFCLSDAKEMQVLQDLITNIPQVIGGSQAAISDIRNGFQALQLWFSQLPTNIRKSLELSSFLLTGSTTPIDCPANSVSTRNTTNPFLQCMDDLQDDFNQCADSGNASTCELVSLAANKTLLMLPSDCEEFSRLALDEIGEAVGSLAVFRATSEMWRLDDLRGNGRPVKVFLDLREMVSNLGKDDDHMLHDFIEKVSEIDGLADAALTEDYQLLVEQLIRPFHSVALPKILMAMRIAYGRGMLPLKMPDDVDSDLAAYYRAPSDASTSVDFLLRHIAEQNPYVTELPAGSHDCFIYIL